MQIKNTILLLVTGLMLLIPRGVHAEFPKEPIKLIVYTNTGGAIDIFSRKFVEIADYYTDAHFEVVNRTGGGGLSALKEVLTSKADGYKLMAVTRSNIGKIISSGGEVDTNDFSWLAMMVSDPEAVIVNANRGISSWDQLVLDAKARGGNQIWVGPARGGNDHIVAMKIWKAAGITAKWIPYTSGGKAMTALLDDHAEAYIGNPQDVLNRPGLKVLVIASPIRVEGRFADVPTFKEVGVDGLEHEAIWRGFMVKKGCPQVALDFYKDLFAKVNSDPAWKLFIEQGSANRVFYHEDKFTERVNQDKIAFSETLKELGLIE